MVALARDGERIPALLERPQLWDECVDAFGLFSELHQRRTVTNGVPDPLPITDVRAWVELQVPDDPEEQRRLTRMIVRADAGWREEWVRNHGANATPRD